MAPKGYPIATSGGFVICDEGVLVIEFMLNKRLNAQLFSLIKAETDKPVTYLGNTSYHGDHAYGNFYVPDAINIIQHEKVADYIANHFVADTEFMMQNFGKGRGIEDIRPVKADTLVKTGGILTIDLGGKAVVITDHGFAQTAVICLSVFRAQMSCGLAIRFSLMRPHCLGYSMVTSWKDMTRLKPFITA